MKTILCLTCLFISISSVKSADWVFPKEELLWEGTPEHDVIHYENGEQTKEWVGRPDFIAPRQRVLSCIDTPTYSIHRPDPEVATDVAMVVCPGGGYRNLAVDREGHEIAMRFAKRGITVMVLKYRLNTNKSDGVKRPFKWNAYRKAVKADAIQAIRILRAQSDELKINPDKVGICGFSAGGHLALMASLNEDSDNDDLRSNPDFAIPIYPGIPERYSKKLEAAAERDERIPMFIIVGRQDSPGCIEGCMDLYKDLIKYEFPAELHIYAKAYHGFDNGAKSGASSGMWIDSLFAWLEDMKIVDRG